MESIGEKLKTAREEKGLSHDQVARDTHIAKRFIAALELEDFSVFPGDPYLIGFLRNYADFLGLESAELISLYKNIRIQEQPAPMEELLQKPFTPGPLLIGGALLAGVAVVGLAIWLVFLQPGAGGRPAEKPAQASIQQKAGEPAAKVIFKDEVLEKPFVQGDTISVVFGERSFLLEVETVGAVVVIKTPLRKVELAQGQETVVDLSGDRARSVKILCSNILKDQKPAQAVLRLDKFIEANAAVSVAAGGPQVQTPEPVVGGTPAVGSTNEASRQRKTQIISEASVRAPFIIEFEFRSICMFRHVLDNQARVERYFKKGETFKTDVRSEIRLWYSNAGAIGARIAGKEIELGRLGEVGSSLIKWVKDETGGPNRIELIPMY
jgi:cytoskeleton protein RodZ